MPACAVAACRNYTKTTKGTDVKYFSFPRDPVTQEEWVWRCGRVTEFNITNSRICSEHFTKDDFERDLMNELLGLPTKRTLKPTALPTINIHGSPPTPEADAVVEQDADQVEAGEEEGYYDDDDDKITAVENFCDNVEGKRRNSVGYHCSACADAGAKYSLTKSGRLRRVVHSKGSQKESESNGKVKRRRGEKTAIDGGVSRGKKRKTWSKVAAKSQTLNERLRAENLKLKKQVREVQARLRCVEKEKDELESRNWASLYKNLEKKYNTLEAAMQTYVDKESESERRCLEAEEEMVVRKTADLHEYAMKPRAVVKRPTTDFLSAIEAAVSVAVGGKNEAQLAVDEDNINFQQPIYVIELPPMNSDVSMETVLLPQV